MVVHSARAAIENARRRVDEKSAPNGPAHCLTDTREHLEIPALLPSAFDAWQDLTGGDRVTYGGDPNDIPPGAPVFSKGDNPSGHVFLSGHISAKSGKRLFFTNDQFGDGRITRVPISFFTNHWHHEILGWGRELNRVAIGYLNPRHGDAAAGKYRVRISALGPGKHNLDVRIVERKLTELGYSRGEHQIKVDGHWGENVTAALRQFQRDQGWTGDDADGMPGPVTMEKLGLHVVD
jgi:hypothetical protein